MIVPDPVVFCSVLASAGFFTFLAWWFPTSSPPGEDSAIGMAASYFRALASPFLAGGLWLIMAGFSTALNNCIASFSACFTSPTFASTTATIFPAFTNSNPLYLFCFGMTLIMFSYGAILVIVIALAFLRPPKKDDLEPPRPA